MRLGPRVTIVCATLNGLDTARLTFSSLHRHTSEASVVLVADNGSTDGTLEYLRGLQWLTVVPLEQRLESSHAQKCDTRKCSRLTVESDPSLITRHGATLDWLAKQVETTFFLTLDSDVEFLDDGWLSDMLDLMDQKELCALGEYVPALGACRARISPHILLLRTLPFRLLGASFQGFARIEDSGEARRWQANSRKIGLDMAQLSSYQTASLYDTGAWLFEIITRAALPWSHLPERISSKTRHLQHMSWASDPNGLGVAPDLLVHHRTMLDYVRGRLISYGEQH